MSVSELVDTCVSAAIFNLFYKPVNTLKLKYISFCYHIRSDLILNILQLRVLCILFFCYCYFKHLFLIFCLFG